MILLFKRSDGTFVAEINGLPYHVINTDERYWNDAVEEAEKMGDALGFEPPLLPITPSAPQVVSRFQARAALYGAGLLDDVETAIADADPLVQMAWADAQEFQRSSPTILSLAAVLGLSESDVDELFITASGIVA